MDEAAPLTSFFRTKKGQKPLRRKGFKAPNHLVRMRSPVRIWVAAPKSPRNRKISGIFVMFLREKIWVKVWVNWATYTLTHYGTRNNRAGRAQCSSWIFLTRSSINSVLMSQNILCRVFPRIAAYLVVGLLKVVEWVFHEPPFFHRFKET